MLELSKCADECRDMIASMFSYGTNDGGETCDDDGCECICETYANTDGTCEKTPHDGFHLYRFENISGGKNFIDLFSCTNQRNQLHQTDDWHCTYQQFSSSLLL